MVLLLTALLALAAPDGDALAQHMAAAERAATAEKDRDWAAAVTACQAAIEVLPTGPRAARCERRIVWFDARRDADGGFDVWSQLDVVRRDTWKTDPDGARTAVTGLRDSADATPLLRAEAGLWLADDALTRLQDPGLALTDTTPLHDTRAALDDEHRRDVTLTHALALARAGKTAEAAAVEAEATVPGNPRTTPVGQEQERARRERVRQASWASIGLFVAAGLTGAWRSTGTPRPWGLLPAGLGVLGAWAIADAWDPGTGDAMASFAPAVVGIHLLSARAQRGTQAPAGRFVLGLLAFLASFAAAWLAFDHTGTLEQVWW